MARAGGTKDVSLIGLSLITLALLSGMVGLKDVRATNSPYATPEVAYCALNVFPCSQTGEQHSPWLGGVDTDSDATAYGVRAAVSYPNTNPSVIQSGNQLGAGIAVNGQSLNTSSAASTAGIDYLYQGFVDVDNAGAIMLVSSGWIDCEWTACPSPYTQANLSACYTGTAGANTWKTCFDSSHWQLFADQFMCSSCSVNDNYIVEMTWQQNTCNTCGYLLWSYYKNGVLWHQFTYTPPVGWLAGTYFKFGSASTQVPTIFGRWYHFQFGVTALFNVNQGGWQVNIANPSYSTLSDKSSWSLVADAQSNTGYMAGTDNQYVLGGWRFMDTSLQQNMNNYQWVTVTGSASGCSELAIFTYTGDSITQNEGQSLWSSAGSGCSSPEVNDPYFYILPSQSSACLFPGTESGVGFTIGSLNGFSGNVAATVSLSPANSYVSAIFFQSSGSTATFSVPSGGSVIAGVNIGASNNANAQGSYTLTVTGMAGSLSNSASLTLTVSYSSCEPPVGGGSGSVASGTLITMADGTRVPVQNVRVGDRVIVYNVPTGYQTTATVDRVVTHTVNNTLTFHTTAGGNPFRADANPNMKLWVLTPSGPVEKPITTVQPGDQIYSYDLGHWVRVTDVTITNGGHHTMYDLLTNPNFTSNGLILEYVANGYPDCSIQCKDSP